MQAGNAIVEIDRPAMPQTRQGDYHTPDLEWLPRRRTALVEARHA